MTKRQTRWCSALACGLLALVANVSGLAHAQSSPGAAPAVNGAAAAPVAAAPATPAPDDAQLTAIARALFDEGLQFVDSGSWEQAADRFSRLLAIRYSAVAAYNLALARSHLGKLVLSAETLRKLLSDPGLDPGVREPAAALQAALERKIGALTVQVEGDAVGCILYVDDQAWPRVAWGVAAPIDPGEHVAQLRRGGSVLRSEKVSVPPGAHLTVTLSLVPSPALVAVRSDADPARAPDAATAADGSNGGGSGVWASPWFWVGVGVVALVGVTAGVAVAASGAEPEAAAPVKGNFMPSVIEGKVQ